MRHLDSQWRLSMGGCLFVLVSELVSALWYSAQRKRREIQWPGSARRERSIEVQSPGGSLLQGMQRGIRRQP